MHVGKDGERGYVRYDTNDNVRSYVKQEQVKMKENGVHRLMSRHFCMSVKMVSESMCDMRTCEDAAASTGVKLVTENVTLKLTDKQTGYVT